VVIQQAKLEWNGKLVPRQATDTAVIHHAAVSQCSIEDIHRWHTIDRKWCGAGYHFLVRKDGAIWLGRPLDVAGAHVAGHNSHTIGVCCEGDFSRERMGLAQLRALIDLLDLLRQLYPGIKVVGHNQLNATECPGKLFPLRFEGVA
jgi:N-acetyl-anhydromuramyl-L-alanine amidase AmpD